MVRRRGLIHSTVRQEPRQDTPHPPPAPRPHEQRQPNTTDPAQVGRVQPNPPAALRPRMRMGSNSTEQLNLHATRDQVESMQVRLAARAERPGGFGTCVPGTPKRPQPSSRTCRIRPPPPGPRRHEHAASRLPEATTGLSSGPNIPHGAGDSSGAKPQTVTTGHLAEGIPAAPVSPQQANTPTGSSCNCRKTSPNVPPA